ncbi:hypothetical protein [Brevundimonas sp.]|uniref:hypothetical protein n=1 Tax=Brevundimonas sp. TaxID=1871086 RepID=UPI0028992FA0|nr:hypothetical protein [Brevundimonas sp.]
MIPAKIEYAVGKTRHNQPLRLVKARTYDGAVEWTLHRDQASQRDDRQAIAGLTDDVILAMADAVKAERSR